MGCGQSQIAFEPSAPPISSSSSESIESDSDSDDPTPSRTAYLENYPDPLGHFKSFFIIDKVSEIIANRDNEPNWNALWFRKMNISFSHSLYMKSVTNLLAIDIIGEIRNPPFKKWRLKMNLKIIIHNLSNEDDSLIYNIRDEWFESGNEQFRYIFLQKITNLRLDDLLDENFGFVKNGQMKLETDIRVLQLEGVDQPMVMNYRLAPEDPKHAYTMTIGDETFYCSRALMDFHSQMEKGDKYFESYTDSKPSDGEIEHFLDGVHGFPVGIGGRGARGGYCAIFYLCEKLKMRALVQRAELVLIQYFHDIPNFYLDCARMYNCRRIIHAWLNRKDSIRRKEVKRLKVKKMTGEMMKAIVKKVFEVGWK
ncbi:hypothetical protein CRE_21314 [Caenorhabditis remanei]|uniref:Uncharacterized protein n=1 Tax=Caenorhabditis remanei TaxID=31234 RepID=E3MUN2_CAERE|nr:hypothetical protein CRE_21314 [Caenorhabditis remanei]